MKCIAEGRPLTREVRRYTKCEYPNPAARDDLGIRTFKEDALTFSNEAVPSSTFDCPENSAVRSPTCPNIRRKAFYAVVTFQGLRTSRGKQPSTKMESSSPLTNFGEYTEGLGLNPSEEMGWSKRRSVAIIRHALGETILIQKV
jgi:hypothetical protein